MKTTKTFSASGLTDAVQPRPGVPFNLFLNFDTPGVGSATLVRAFDGGSTYYTVTDAQGNAATWTANLNTTWIEWEDNVTYKWDVTRTSGSIIARISGPQ